MKKTQLMSYKELERELSHNQARINATDDKLLKLILTDRNQNLITEIDNRSVKTHSKKSYF